MNRFSNYLKSAQLAKMQARQAQEYARKGEIDKAMRMTLEAFESLFVACNNVASMTFERREKR